MRISDWSSDVCSSDLAPFAFKGLNYGASFFMATGFHGFHVIIGTLFLIVCLIRAYKGDFHPRQNFGFDAAAWYWHFVAVVCLFLFFPIYVWGGWGGPYHRSKARCLGNGGFSRGRCG